MIAPAEHGIEVLVQFAMDVIRRAGDEALQYYGRGEPHIRFDEGLVTEAELRLEDFFQRELRSRFPDHLIFQNATVEKGYSHGENRYVWIYDAIDGVSNFQAGIPIWGTSLALLENFWPLLGVFFMPSTGDFFHARAGQKAFWGEQAIRIPRQGGITDESFLLTYSRFHNDYRATFPGKIRNLGCAGAHICYVARGRADAAIIANESYQNLAATRIILEAAGGKIFGMDGKEVFLNEYLDGRRIDDHLLVAAPKTCDQLRAYLQRTS
jgi:myo-inositol-1(or 4)-monophosphatase